MSLSGPLAFHTVASTLLDAIRQRLAATAAGAPERACVVPAAIAWDQCECGLLAVSVARTYPSASFPSESFGDPRTGAGSPCPPPLLLADLAVQLIRCAPGPDQRGNSPSCAALDTAAQTVLTDAYLARLGAFCTLRELEAGRDITDYLVRAQAFLGPEGGCVGSELLVTVAVKAPCC